MHSSACQRAELMAYEESGTDDPDSRRTTPSQALEIEARHSERKDKIIVIVLTPQRQTLISSRWSSYGKINQLAFKSWRKLKGLSNFQPSGLE